MLRDYQQHADRTQPHTTLSPESPAVSCSVHTLIVQSSVGLPTALIPVLYSKRLISDTNKINLTTLTGVGNIDKATRLLTAVETTMKAEPRAARVVRELCEAVYDQPALRHVADRITTALGE